MLAGYRVLDLSDEKGQFCGRLLADLGADVIKVEPPQGDPARKLGPFVHDIPHPERSLFWLAYNGNKRSITLNLETADGQQLLRELAKGADFVIESFPPGYMDSLGLGYSDMEKIEPSLIMTSITPFGQSGPYKDYKGPDIVCMAMGGYMFVTGAPERPPLRVSLPQAYLWACTSALSGTLMAHYYRKTSGEGQQVDVSVQESVLWCTTNLRIWWDTGRVIQRRAGYRRGSRKPGTLQTIAWPCRDGFVIFSPMGGSMGDRQNSALVQWMDSEGMAGSLRDIDWKASDIVGSSDQEEWDKVEKPIMAFFNTHTKAELYEGAMQWGIAITPQYSIGDVVEDAQLEARDFWQFVKHDDSGLVLNYPGAFVKAFSTPCRKPGCAPKIGEHNEEVYSTLGLDRKQLIALKEASVI